MKRLSCEELVELVSGYLDDELDETARHRFDDHLRRCEGCARYVGQLRVTVQALGELPPEKLSASARERLLRAFRDSRRT